MYRSRAAQRKIFDFAGSNAAVQQPEAAAAPPGQGQNLVSSRKRWTAFGYCTAGQSIYLLKTQCFGKLTLLHYQKATVESFSTELEQSFHNINIIMLKPIVKLNEPGKKLRGCH